MQLILKFQMTKDLTIPKFGVLSYSSIYKRRETVLVNVFVEGVVICKLILYGKVLLSSKQVKSFLDGQGFLLEPRHF